MKKVLAATGIRTLTFKSGIWEVSGSNPVQGTKLKIGGKKSGTEGKNWKLRGKWKLEQLNFVGKIKIGKIWILWEKNFKVAGLVAGKIKSGENSNG